MIDCPTNDCRIERGETTSTFIGWIQLYDKHGVELNSNPNTYTRIDKCHSCNRKWKITRNSRFGGIDKAEEIK